MCLLEKTVKALAEHVGGWAEGDEALVVTRAATLGEAGPEEVSFLANPKYAKAFETSKAAVVVVGDEVEANGKTVIHSKDPYHAFMQIVVLLYGYRQHRPVGISAKASVDETAHVGAGADVHEFVSVAEDTQIGDRTRIYPHCTVGAGSTIGDDCIIFPNVTIYDGCKIGDRVTIHAGSVIGQDGFGYATQEGVHHKIPQVGGVLIEDDVEIGANCTIDRGTLGDTVIGRGCKFSNQITIGHNTRIGPHCLLVAQVGIAGSTTVGDHCVFGGQVGVVGHINIGNQVTIGAQSGVSNDIKNGHSVFGTPAIPITQAKKSLLLVKHLPEIRQKLRELDKNLRHLIKGK